ncbi:MAG: hypothetical protein C5B43_04715 [Verrucomicrobia bacterium]|nr:MAG: hypothetical protein C5B43_04715 [Verrucomicrobiota bacterium]
MIFLYLIFGLIIGLTFSLVIYFKQRTIIVELENDKELLHQEKQTVIEFIHSLIQSIDEGTKRSDLYQRIVHCAILSNRALSACLYESYNGTFRAVATEGLFPPLKNLKELYKHYFTSTSRTELIETILRSESFALGEGLIGTVAQTKKTILIPHAKDDPRVIQHYEPTLMLHSIIIAPILFKNNLLGVLAVANPIDSLPFNSEDQSVTESLAEQAGMAIHNSNLMNLLIEQKKIDFDLSLASNIQGMLLPKQFPKNNSIQIDAYYQPAQKVGGDLYDVFALSENKIGIAIADVSGKGIPASILMAICQTNLRHLAQKHTSPSAVLKEMNFVMHPEIRQGMFITITYAILDTISNTITLARAGHELPLIFKYNDKEDSYHHEKIISPGMALGMVPQDIFDNVIQDTSISFNPKDTFILYTDGITEATNKEDEEFGINRLNRSILPSLKSSTKNINEKVITDLEEFTEQTKNMDDLTLVTIKYTGLGHSL